VSPARRRTAPTFLVVLLATLLIALGCGSERTASSPEEVARSPVVVAAGDIGADCRPEGGGAAEATAELVSDIQGTVLALGGLTLPRGSAESFRECYNLSWGYFKGRTKPVPGNHEYYTQGAAGYFDYFGKAAGDPDRGYYSYNLGRWHIVALNSNCGQIDGCEASSPQGRWLKADLAANKDKSCTLAYMHHPRFSSGEVTGGNSHEVRPLWEALYEAGAEVVLSAHELNYERFAPQTSGGRERPERGIRQFVVGTGGRGHYPIVEPIANSEVHNDETYGVLKLTLNPKSYEWRFVPVEGETFSDSGSARCH
jgi:calcineurin-like phosphoesterase family protein